jgi:hypothetical protein
MFRKLGREFYLSLAFTIMGPGISILANKPKAAVYLLGVGLTIVLWIFILAGVRQLDETQETKKEAEHHGVLKPGNEPQPQHPCHEMPDGAFVILLGNSASYTTMFPHTILEIRGEEILSVSKSDEGLLLSGKVFSRDGRIVAQLIDNEFFINPNNYFRKDRPDQTSLVVYDQRSREVLRVHFINPSTMKVLGVFHYPGTQPVIIREEFQMIGTIRMSRTCFGNNRKDIVIR